ncbi:MAG: hypothetical protein ABSF70_09970 [Terracidiphilus sp.]
MDGFSVDPGVQIREQCGHLFVRKTAGKPGHHYSLPRQDIPPHSRKPSANFDMLELWSFPL